MTEDNVPPSVKRRQYIVKAGLQWKIVGGVVGATVVSFLLMFWDYYYFFARTTPSNLMDRDMWWIFVQAQKPMIFQLLIFVFAFFFVAVVFSHRVAGPLFSLERGMRRVAGGDLVHSVHLRKHDHLNDTKDEFNHMIKALHDRLATDRQLGEELSKELQHLLALDHFDASAREKLRHIAGKLHQITHQFSL